MVILILPALLAVASTVFADVTYNVVGFPSTDGNKFAVEINKKLHVLKTSEANFPLWSGEVAGASESTKYRYVEVDKANKVVQREGFDRKPELAKKGSDAVTVNQFFNRKATFTKLPTIKQIYKNPYPKPTKAFDDSQIATIHLTADKTAFDDMLNNPLEKRKIPANFKFINAGTVYSANQVEIKVSGKASRKYDKVSIGVKIGDGKSGAFFNRPIIKLRAERTDPTMLREKMYLDVLAAIGVPASYGSFARVYVNGKPLGLFLMMEDIESPFLMNTVHHGEIKSKDALGSLYKINSGKLGTHRYASLRYQGDKTANYDKGLYKNEILGNNPKNEPMKQLIEFMKVLNDWKASSAGGISFWNQHFELPTFLRSMAMEYLTGAWDAFWWKANNYLMYYNPQRKIWQFLPTDFDHTFSNNNLEGVETTYKKYGYYVEGKKPDFPLIDKVIYANKETNKEFEKILLTITKQAFNLRVLGARLNACEKQIENDVEWDYSIDRSHRPGNHPKMTMEKFHKGINDPKKSLKAWIKGREESVAKEIKASKA
ncbi:hypothetical protein BGZ73_004327 [Actinomortierella ambigua]|nr:hypothetical protein BGZ73_004327 [Actinomortierella ambigua]